MIDPAWTQAELESVVQSQMVFFNGYPEESQCPNAMYRNLCTLIFPECLEKNFDVIKRGPLFNADGTPRMDPEDSTKQLIGDVESKKLQLAVQLRPPTSLCNDLVNSCGPTPFYELASQYYQPFANCTHGESYQSRSCVKDSVGMRNFLGRYETSASIYTTANPDVRIQGQIFAQADFNLIADIPLPTTCPYPLVLPNSDSASTYPILGGRCHRACPYGVVTDHDRETIMNVADICSIIIMSAIALLCLSFLVFKSQRHKRVMFWYTLSYFFVPFMMFLAVRVQERSYNSQCRTNTELYHFTGWPLAQGIIMIFALLSSSCWWLMLAVDLFLRLIMGRIYKRGTTQARRRDIAMHMFSWGLPAICVGGLLCGKYIGYDYYLPFAFTAPDPTASETLFDLQWIFVFLPIILDTFIGFVLVAIILWFLFRYESTARPVNDPHQAQRIDAQRMAMGMDKTPGRLSTSQEDNNGNPAVGDLTLTTSQDPSAAIGQVPQSPEEYQPTAEMAKFQSKMTDGKHNWRFKFVQSMKLFGFIFIQLFMIGVFLGFSLTRARFQGQWDADLEAYEICLITTADSGACQLASQIPTGVIILGVVSYLIPGLIMFCLYFVAQSDLYRLWCGLLHYKLGISILSSFALEDTTSGTGSSSGSSSKSSKGSNGSSDLLTGDFALRKKRNKDNTHDSADGPTDTNTMGTQGDTQMTMDSLDRDDPYSPGNAYYSPNNPDKKEVKVRTTRRQTMFKGLKSSDPRYGQYKISEYYKNKVKGNSYDYDEETTENDDDFASRGMVASPSVNNHTIEMADMAQSPRSPMSITQDLDQLREESREDHESEGDY